MKRLNNIRTLLVVALTLMATLCCERATAQHTLTATGGIGSSYVRFYPTEVTEWMWSMPTLHNGSTPRPLYNVGLAWRYYSDKPRFVGAVGVDLEFIERGYRYGYDFTTTFEGEGDDRKEIRHYKFYNRRVNTLMLPLVWQPHVYALKNRLRFFIEAALVLSFNISSDYRYDDDANPNVVHIPMASGVYNWKTPRDNRFGYGLSGGAGFALLFGQVEVGFKAKYNFGYSDILKNRNKYYSNSTDVVYSETGRKLLVENPFYYNPLRSPIDCLTFSLTLGWRFDARGFNEWFVVRPKRERGLDTFNFSAQTGASNPSSPGGGGSRGGTNNSRPSSNNPTRPGGGLGTSKGGR